MRTAVPNSRALVVATALLAACAKLVSEAVLRRAADFHEASP